MAGAALRGARSSSLTPAVELFVFQPSDQRCRTSSTPTCSSSLRAVDDLGDCPHRNIGCGVCCWHSSSGASVAASMTVLHLRSRDGHSLRRFAAGGCRSQRSGHGPRARPADGLVPGQTAPRSGCCVWICRGYLPRRASWRSGSPARRGGLLAAIVALTIVPLSMARLSPGRMVMALIAVRWRPGRWRRCTSRRRSSSGSRPPRPRWRTCGSAGGSSSGSAGLRRLPQHPSWATAPSGFIRAITPRAGTGRPGGAQFVHLAAGGAGDHRAGAVPAHVPRRLRAVAAAAPARSDDSASCSSATLVIAMTPLTWEDQKSVWFVLAALVGLRHARVIGRRPTRSRRGCATPGRPWSGSPMTRRPLGPPVLPARDAADVTPRVSVVTTVYNGEPYFDRAIPGILAQTFDDFEFILVDDGSTDRTPPAAAGAGPARPAVRVFAPGRLGAAGLQLRRRAGPGRIHRPPGLRRPQLSRPAAAPGGAAGRPPRGRASWAAPTCWWTSAGASATSGCRPTDHPALLRGHGALRPHRPHGRHLPAPGLGRGRRLSAGEEPDRPPVLPRGSPSWAGSSPTCPRWWASTTCTTPAGSTGSTATSSGSATSRGCRRRASASSGLPRWMYVYSLGRHVYAYVPPGLEARAAARGGEVAGAGPVRILLLSTSMGMGGADQQLLVRGAGTSRPRTRGAHRLAHAAGRDGARARAAGLAHRVAGDAAGHPRPARAGPAGPAGARLAARRCSTATCSMPTSWRARSGSSRRFRRSSPPSTTSTKAGRLRMLGYRLTNGLVDHMTIISQAAADRFIGERHRARAPCSRSCPTAWTPSATACVPPGTRERLRQSLGLGGEFAWLAVGRFEAAKDYPNMLRAFARVRGEQPDGGAAAGRARVAPGGDRGAGRRRWDWTVGCGSWAPARTCRSS